MSATTAHPSSTSRATRVSYRITISQDLARRLEADQLRPVTQADLERLLFSLMAQGMGSTSARKVLDALLKARTSLFPGGATVSTEQRTGRHELDLQRRLITQLHGVDGLSLDDIRALSWPQVRLHLGEVVVKASHGPVHHELSADTLLLLKELKDLRRRAQAGFLSTSPLVFTEEALATWTGESGRAGQSPTSVTAA